MDLRLASIKARCQTLSKQPGVHSVVRLEAAGFVYTHNGDIARCNICHLEVSGWTTEMIPFNVHKERSPNCEFVRSLVQPATTVFFSNSTAPVTSSSRTNTEVIHENSCVAENLNKVEQEFYSDLLENTDANKRIRRRTFSGGTLHCEQCLERMVTAGFFSCNVDDRVICLHCNLVCHRWIPHSDDPCEVHQTLSPQCSFVKNMSTTNKFYSNSVVPIVAASASYRTIPERIQSFNRWNSDSSSNVEALVTAGFFYLRFISCVQCFYCGGTLNVSTVNQNPIREHARHFPHCGYAKQLCGNDLHRNIQKSAHEEKKAAQNNKSMKRKRSDDDKLFICDEDTLSNFVTARMGLPMSQSLIAQHFQPSIIKYCWETQLRLKGVNFETVMDLTVAYVIRRSEMISIDQNNQSIVIPDEKMNAIHKQQSERFPAPNLCLVCCREERCFACVPCGHMHSCSSCQTLPCYCQICRQSVEKFLRVYSG